MRLEGWPPAVGSTFRVQAVRVEHGRNETYTQVHHVRAHVDGLVVVRWWCRGRRGWEYEIIHPERWHVWTYMDGFVREP